MGEVAGADDPGVTGATGEVAGADDPGVTGATGVVWMGTTVVEATTLMVLRLVVFRCEMVETEVA